MTETKKATLDATDTATTTTELTVENTVSLPQTQYQQATTAFTDFETAESTTQNEKRLNLDRITDEKEEKTDKTFYLNLMYLLFWGFNTFFCLANNPFFVNNQKQKKITLDEKAEFNLDDESRQFYGAESLGSGLNEQMYKSGFNIGLLGDNYLPDDAINKTHLVCFLHKFTVAFNDSAIKDGNFRQDSYEAELEKMYQMNAGHLRDIIVTNFGETNVWCSLPNMNRGDQELGYLSGYVFPSLSSSINSKPIFHFFSKIKKNATNKHPQSFIVLDKSDFSVGLLKKHFKTDKGKQLLPEEIDALDNRIITLFELVKSLPAPFNQLPERYEDTTNSAGQIETHEIVYYEDLIAKWNNVRFKAMIKGNALTYDAGTFFIDEHSQLFRPLRITNFDSFYEKFVQAILNIVKCLLLYRDENGQSISLVPFLTKK